MAPDIEMEEPQGALLVDPSQPPEAIDPDLDYHDFLLDDNLVEAPVHNNNDVRSPCKENLGALDKLPLEILHEILSQLDLYSLTSFRDVNRRASESTESMLQYQIVSEFAPKALQGILIIGTARWITCQDLFNKLCTASCEICGDFGGYLYLLTCKRVCFVCFSEGERCLPLRLNQAARKFGLNRVTLRKLPQMCCLPGTYSPQKKQLRVATKFVDFESARNAGIALHGSIAAMERYASDKLDEKLYHYQMRVRENLKSFMDPYHRVRRPRTEDPVDRKTGNPFRFMAVVATPWLNRVSQKPEWGYYCAGCLDYAGEWPLHSRRKYTLASFSEHLRECGEIEDGEHQPHTEQDH